MTRRTELDEIGDVLARLKYQLMGIKFELKLRRLSISTKDGFDPDQPRDENGKWTEEGQSSSSGDASADNQPSENQVFAVFSDLASFPLATRIGRLLGDSQSDQDEAVLQEVGAKITYDTARTGIPTIDETTEKLSEILITTMNNMEFIPNQAPNVYGIAVHTNFASAVRTEDLTGIGSDGVEETFSLTDVRHYGVAGSIRTDVTLRNVAGEIVAIYDVKTGGAVLSASRADTLRARTNAAPYTPVIELHFHRGSSLKHEQITQDFENYSASGARHRDVWAATRYKADRLHRERLFP